MLSSGRKGICSIPKWTWIYAESLRRASTSSFFKWPSLFGSKTGVQNEAEQKQGTPGRKEYYVPRKFVPMTRKALIRRILEDENLVNTQDRHYFQDLAVHLDKAIAGTFHGVLGELKALYDPLNPDKETLTLQKFSKKERLDNEFWLLEKLSQLLEKAHFYELPVDEVHEALKEHDAGDGVLVSVDPKKYDVLRVWVVGKEFEPVDTGAWYSRIASGVVHWFKPSVKAERYKRVVIAIRAKKQNKLMLKSFKDIRCANLEHLLPEGKIRMTQFDQRVLAGTLTVGVAGVVIKLVSFLADYKISWTYIAISVAGIVALRAWNMYKNKRNSYLVRLSQTLYFKSIANNRALLTLLADRAEDEVFKVTLLAYSFLQASSNLQPLSGTDIGSGVHKSDGMTVSELKQHVEDWMNSKFQVTLKYDPSEAIKQLENLGLLTMKQKGEQEIFSVLPVIDAFMKLPSPKESMKEALERTEELDVELTEAATEEEIEQMHDKQREELEQKKMSWD
ncbi:transmembrane protein 143-like isoform X2 [Oculina patagonica]